jgi:hypothetical protein
MLVTMHRVNALCQVRRVHLSAIAGKPFMSLTRHLNATIDPLRVHSQHAKSCAQNLPSKEHSQSQHSKLLSSKLTGNFAVGPTFLSLGSLHLATISGRYFAAMALMQLAGM